MGFTVGLSAPAAWAGSSVKVLISQEGGGGEEEAWLDKYLQTNKESCVDWQKDVV
jgi:hypothetical protein